jgi:hypothetical protein
LRNISLGTQLFNILNFNEGSIAPYCSIRVQLCPPPPNSEDVLFLNKVDHIEGNILTQGKIMEQYWITFHSPK